MSDVLVHLASAVICFNSQCHPALIGRDTPIGTFPLVHARVLEPGYGGDLLVFAQRRDITYAIHRVYHVPSQRRELRLDSLDPYMRTDVTHGCVNIKPATYDELIRGLDNRQIDNVVVIDNS